jgi:molybdenum cofactor cytidylyltransferase
VEIKVVDNPKVHRFEALTPDGDVAGFINYRDLPDHLVLVHTEVKPEYDGQGIGSALVRQALDQIRERGRSIVPQCPFVAAYLRRHPDYQDLVAES